MDIANSTEVSGSFKLRDFFRKLLFHWPLFFIFFVLCLCVAFFYLKYKRPTYQIFAKVMIKDQPKDANKAALEAINLTENPRGVDEQLGLLSSIPVTRQVVEDLQLWVTYLEPTHYYSYKDLYTGTPVLLKILIRGKEPLRATFNITVESDSTFLLKQSNGKDRRFFLNNTFVNGFGTWKLIKTENFKQFIGKSIQIRLREVDDAVGYYQSNIHESPIPKSSNVNIYLPDEVPERGRNIVDDLIRVYMAASVEEKRKSTQNTIKFVDERLVSITSELNNVENKYAGYKSNRGITEIADLSQTYVGGVQSNANQVNEIKNKITVLDGIERYLSSSDGKGGTPSTLGIDDPVLQGLMDRFSEHQAERNKLLATLPESNPLFIPINQQISSAKIAVYENLKTTRAALVQTQQSLQHVGSSFQSTIKSLPGAERDLVDIKRMQGIKENLYTYLLQKKEELSLDYASTIADAAILEPANNGPQSDPIPQAVYAVAILFALLIPTGLIIGRDALKGKITNKNAVTTGTGLPVLVEINNTDNKESVVVLNQKTFIGEQFRDLRTKLSYLHKNSNSLGKTTMFTSSISGEGKSFVLSNLGSVLAIADKKTILVELDLRRPTLAKRFQLKKNSLGLTDYIIGNATKKDIIQVSAISENLHIICGGAVPPNPSELLESTQLSDLIKELKLQYDHILIDTPPVHVLTDAMIIAPLCDLCLYVVREGYTPRKELSFIKELYAEKKLPRLKLILNAVSTDQVANSYLYQNNGYIKEPAKTINSRFKKFVSRF